MKNKFLPFQIGEQYENWEFDLEYEPEGKIPGLDSYIYLWKKSFLQVIPSQIELYFSMDILELVTMTCEFKSLQELYIFREILDETFGNRTQIQNETLDSEHYHLSNGIEIRLLYVPLGYRLDITYGRDTCVRMYHES